MQLLNSKNHEEVHVHLRDDEVIVLPPTTGQKLMDYLTGDVTTKHVKLTDRNNNAMVVLITDIRKVEPIAKMGDFDNIVERFLTS